MTRPNFCNGRASALTWYHADFIDIFWRPSPSILGMNCRVRPFLPPSGGRTGQEKTGAVASAGLEYSQGE
jgi:hypothetical protein